MNVSIFQFITADDWQRVLRLYDDLQSLTEQDRRKQLTDSDLDPKISAVVQKMLNGKDTFELIDTPVDNLAEALLGEAGTAAGENPSDMIGRQLGVWRIEQSLAEGGMGQVFVGQRADGQFDKKVAIKTIKTGQFTAATQQKFSAEMRTLAQLEHPHIARLIDGGVSDDGILYIVMELVEGISLCDYAREQALSLNQRIELMRSLCEAVAYAHQNLIIHGDLKPNNVLVNEQGHIKLVDFGVARPIDPWVEMEHENTLLPPFTPVYAPPEQARGRKLTTASDVYGLCAILYELCCGLPPREAVSQETKQAYFQHAQTPIIPIQDRLLYWRDHATDFKEQMAGVDFGHVQKALKRELGAVISKGVATDPQDRYQNCTDLQTDLRRLLSNEPIAVYSLSSSYRLKKRINQYKLPIVVACVGLFGIMAFAWQSAVQSKLAQAEAQKARESAQQANWTSDFLLNIFDQADPVKNQQNPITVNELTAIASEQLLNDDSEYVPAVRLNALSLMGNIQSKLGQAEVATKIHLKKIELLKQNDGGRPDLAQAYFDVAMDYQQLGLFEPALEYFNLAAAVIPIDEKVTHMGVTGLQSVAMIYLRLNKPEEAEVIINKLLSMENEILKADKPFESMSNVYTALTWLAEANENYELGLAAIEKTKFYFSKLPYDPIYYAQLLANESSIYSELHQYDLAVKLSREGVAIFKQHYGLNHPETMIMLSRHASLLGQSGDLPASIKAYHQVINIMENNEVPDFFAPSMYQNLAHKYSQTEQCDRALEYFKKAESLWGTLESPRVSGEMATLSGMARCHLMLDNLLLSESYFNQTLLVAKEVYGSESGQYAQYQLMMVPLLLQQNKIAELNDMMPKIYQPLVAEYGSQSPRVAHAALSWARLYKKQADIENAHLMARQALAIYRQSEPASSYLSFIEEAESLTKSL